MQEIFIKAVTAPDDSRDIMHYEAYFGNEEPKMFASRKEAVDYLLKKIEDEEEQLHQDLRHLRRSHIDWDEFSYRAEKIINALENCEMIKDNLHYMEIHEEIMCFFFKTLSD